MNKIQKAKKEIKEAQEAVYDAAECEGGCSKRYLEKAAFELEKAEADVEEIG
ncbi:MAG: hypothetical protein WC438_04895 [Candidatus Pacearchaeota archaeon]